MTDIARETSGVTTRLTLRYVRTHGRPGAVARVLAAAGLADRAVQLEDERSWSTYNEKIALLEAAAEELGDPHVSRHVGESVLEHRVGAPLKLILRALGSPAQVLRNVARAAPKFSTVCTMEALEVARSGAVVSYRLHDGYRPHRLDCELNIGLMSQVSVLFGMPPATISHVECQVTGAGRCVYRVRWQRRHFLPWRSRAAAVATLDDRLATVTERSEALQATIADLASPDDVDVVLARVAARAGVAVRAQGYLLAVRPRAGDELHLHHDGISEDRARRLAATLAASGAAGDETLAVRVASARRDYGWLAAVSPPGMAFFDEERHLLSAYARHAAVALDAATALEDAKVRGETASVLLDLARTLAEPATSEEVAHRIAASVPTVVGARRAAVGLWNAEAGALVVRATHAADGPPPQALGVAITPAESPELAAMLEAPQAHDYRVSALAEGFSKRREGRGGGDVLAVPITRRGLLLGVIFVDNGPAGPPPTLTPAVSARAAGLADQAATALENAALLERERARSESLHARAYFDAVSHLPNRALLDERLAAAAGHAARSGAPIAVLFIDIDRFKTVNDTFGHDAGDLLLRAVGERLVHRVRADDTVARIGGDEFVVVLPRLRAESDARLVARNLLTAFAEPFGLAGDRVEVSASIGVAAGPRDGLEPAELLRRADAAMYRAKRQGGNRVRTYEPARGHVSPVATDAAG